MENKRFHEIMNVLFLIFWFIIILCTSTVLFVILRYWHSHCRSIVNLLICNSCFALFFCAITYSIQTPSVIQQIYFDGLPSSALFCQISACLTILSTGVVAHSCIVQAITRFFISSLSTWLINVIIAVGMFISPYAYQYDPESLYCMLTAHHFPTAISVSVLFALVSLLILMILYGIVLRYTIYQTRINPNSQSTLKARRNKRIFQNIIFTFNLYGIAGISYLFCLIMNRINYAPWPFYSIQVLSFPFTAAVHSIFLFVTNKQVKEILFAKLTGRPINTRGTGRINQVVPIPISNRQTVCPLKTIS
ncbi:hypothetical protein I4U23_015410 [Adineta vaga]|nr:hypothetical protein I4U23_015410 [Adineta vaga]